MRKLLVLFVLSSVLLSASVNECKTDIWFGNGVFNTKKDARRGLRYLENHIVKPVLIGGTPAKRAKYLPMHLAYNKHASWDLDLIETFYQMKEAGQISQTGYFTLLDQLLAVRASSITNTSLQQMRNIIDGYITRTEADNQQSIWNAYYNTTLKHSHRLLLVSHSQGNLFANRVFENYVAPAGYGGYFANLQIASPADHIAAPSGSYVTNCVDPVINPLPGSMGCNVNGFGHTLIGSYLDGGPDSIEAKNKIMADLGNLASVLDAKPSQWQISRQPSDRTQCRNIRVSVAHRFDTALAPINGVYPFMQQGFRLYPVNGEYVLASCGGSGITDMQSQQNNQCYRLEGPGLILFKDTNCTFRVNGEDFCETGTFVHSYTTGTGYYPSVWHKKAGSNMGNNIDWAFGLNAKWDTSRVKWTVPGVYPYGVTFVVEYDGKTETWTHQRHTKA